MPRRRFGARECDRAQAWASLELDGELSQLERALLAAHIRRCESCAPRVAEVRAVTAALRRAPLERPTRTLFVPRRRTRVATRLALAATLAVLAAGVGGLAGSLGEEREDRPPPPQPDLALLPSADVLRDVEGVRRPGEQRRPFVPPDRVGGV